MVEQSPFRFIHRFSGRALPMVEFEPFRPELDPGASGPQTGPLPEFFLGPGGIGSPRPAPTFTPERVIAAPRRTPVVPPSLAALEELSMPVVTQPTTPNASGSDGATARASALGRVFPGPSGGGAAPGGKASSTREPSPGLGDGDGSGPRMEMLMRLFEVLRSFEEPSPFGRRPVGLRELLRGTGRPGSF